MILFFYLVSIVAANIITASLAPVQLGFFIVPYGTFLIGLTFVFRDLTQNRIGRNRTYLAIAAALVLSGITSWFLGDSLFIAAASLMAFLISETTDTEIYTRLKMKIEYRIFYSGVVGGFLDSIIFVIIGLSPIGANFLSWSQVTFAIIGQIIVKTFMQALALICIKIVGQNKKVTNKSF